MRERKEEVRAVTHGNTGWIIFDTPPMNIITRESFDRAAEIHEEYENNRAIDAIVLAGANKHFCGGANLRWMQSLQRFPEIARETVDGMYRSALKITKSTKPIIGAIEEGACCGIGFEIACSCCDYVVVKKGNAASVAFGALAPKYAFMLGLGITWSLSQKIGVPNTVQILLKTGTFNAIEAGKLGIIDTFLWGDDLIKEANHFSHLVLEGEIPKKISPPSSAGIAPLTPEEIETFAPEGSMSAAYRTLAAIETCAQARTLEEAMEMEKQFFLELLLSDEAKKRIDAFLDSRKRNV